MPPVTPKLTSIVICDNIIEDKGTNKKSLIGIFNTINARRFPCTHQILSIFACVTDAQGVYDFTVHLEDLSDGTQLAEIKLPPITIDDPLGICELVVTVQRIVFKHAGKYDFNLLANGEYLGSKDFHVVQADEE